MVTVIADENYVDAPEESPQSKNFNEIVQVVPITTLVLVTLKY
jgi:hypothetical protein